MNNKIFFAKLMEYLIYFSKISRSFKKLLIYIRKAYNGVKHNPNFIFKPNRIIKIYKTFEKESGLVKNEQQIGLL